MIENGYVYRDNFYLNDNNPSVDLLSDFKNSYSVLYGELNKKLSKKEVGEYAQRIAEGKQIASSLLYSNESERPQPTYDNSLNLALFLMASGYQANGQLFARGVVRFYNFPEAGNEIFRQFFLGTQDANNKDIAYTRISSHFRGMTENKQVGIDFGKGAMPLDPKLSTMLCGCLKDKQFFMKFETAAWNPTKKPRESGEHAVNYIKHKVSSGKENRGIHTTRETDGQEKIRNKFEAIVKERENLAYQVKKEFKKIDSTKAKKELKKSKRIFEMNRRVTEIKEQLLIIKTADDQESNTAFLELDQNTKSDVKHTRLFSADKLLSTIREFEEEIAPLEYPEMVSGKEALIDIQSLIPAH